MRHYTKKEIVILKEEYSRSQSVAKAALVAKLRLKEELDVDRPIDGIKYKMFEVTKALRKNVRSKRRKELRKVKYVTAPLVPSEFAKVVEESLILPGQIEEKTVTLSVKVSESVLANLVSAHLNAER